MVEMKLNIPQGILDKIIREVDAHNNFTKTWVYKNNDRLKYPLTKSDKICFIIMDYYERRSKEIREARNKNLYGGQ